MGGYTREIGNGRLCVLTPGHILSVWRHDEFKSYSLMLFGGVGRKYDGNEIQKMPAII